MDLLILSAILIGILGYISRFIFKIIKGFKRKKTSPGEVDMIKLANDRTDFLLKNKDSFVGWKIWPIRDGRLCEDCEERARYLYPPNDPPRPPFHDGCRCVVGPLLHYLPSHQKMAAELIPISQRSTAFS